MKIGSQEHKERFCRQFIASHPDYNPDTLPWPELDGPAHERLRSVPFWQEVLRTERRAGAIVNEFAKTIDDPVIHEAVALQGLEESRHARLLEVMIERYKIEIDEPPLGGHVGASTRPTSGVSWRAPERRPPPLARTSRN